MTCHLYNLGLCPACEEQQKLEEALDQWEMLQELISDDTRGVSR